MAIPRVTVTMARAERPFVPMGTLQRQEITEQMRYGFVKDLGEQRESALTLSTVIKTPSSLIPVSHLLLSSGESFPERQFYTSKIADRLEELGISRMSIAFNSPINETKGAGRTMRNILMSVMDKPFPEAELALGWKGIQLNESDRPNMPFTSGEFYNLTERANRITSTSYGRTIFGAGVGIFAGTLFGTYVLDISGVPNILNMPNPFTYSVLVAGAFTGIGSWMDRAGMTRSSRTYMLLRDYLKTTASFSRQVAIDETCEPYTEPIDPHIEGAEAVRNVLDMSKFSGIRDPYLQALPADLRHYLEKA